MSLPIARDLASHVIRVNIVAPVLFTNLLLAGLPIKMQEAMGTSVPFPAHLGQPAEFAQLVQAMVEKLMLNGEVIQLPPK